MIDTMASFFEAVRTLLLDHGYRPIRSSSGARRPESRRHRHLGESRGVHRARPRRARCVRRVGQGVAVVVENPRIA